MTRKKHSMALRRWMRRIRQTVIDQVRREIKAKAPWRARMNSQRR